MKSNQLLTAEERVVLRVPNSCSVTILKFSNDGSVSHRLTDNKAVVGVGVRVCVCQTNLTAETNPEQRAVVWLKQKKFCPKFMFGYYIEILLDKVSHRVTDGQ